LFSNTRKDTLFKTSDKPWNAPNLNRNLSRKLNTSQLIDERQKLKACFGTFSRAGRLEMKIDEKTHLVTLVRDIDGGEPYKIE